MHKSDNLRSCADPSSSLMLLSDLPRYSDLAMKPVPHFATQELRSQAKTLRLKATPSEAALWAEIRSRRMQGLKFRRQHIALGYILDFYCPEYRLAIELDGSHHDPVRDAQRDQTLARWHVTVLRFPTHKPTEEIIAAIHAAVRGLQLQMVKQAAYSTSLLKQMDHDATWYAARRLQLKRQAVQLELEMSTSAKKLNQTEAQAMTLKGMHVTERKA